ncbi:hypothetical protein HYPDE_31123 [Hyphomicrobium denitrificans 1NES1]|uniref:Uncharacterized protein n=1 Tax=Hyphomicrobium denitrificans 1NES1 TaxID=670307 RepID=N0B301_9HYPH|nr:hypothetical protein HYPDE_31123 [Hyphomicrobium denitrificans 1NES1]
MDLEAAHVRNSRADKLARLSMALCFLISSGILLGTLALATPDQSPARFETSASR